jgi:MOSC domain-containing protein YiiM
MKDLRQLCAEFPHAGRLDAIWLRPARGEAALGVRDAIVEAGRGVQGDRASRGREGGKRQVTLLQAEHLPVIAALLRRETVDAADLRRNFVVSGLNLLAAKSLFADQPLRLAIGAEVELEFTGPCEPCSKMEDHFGPGAYNALRGHGGMTARVLRGGRISVGDAVVCRTVARDRDALAPDLFDSPSQP